MATILNPYVRLYALIRSKSDEATSNEAVAILEEAVKEKVIAETKQLATKSDLSGGLTYGRKGIAEAFADSRKELEEAKTDIIKWMFILSVAQIVVLCAILFDFLKFYCHPQ